MRARFAQLLGHPRLPLVAALLAVLLCLPALGAGLFSDDWVHRAIILGSGPFPASERPLLDLFSFVHPQAPHLEVWHELGIFPWWSHPDFAVAFLRPVAAATHLLDLGLWPDNVPLQHAHSLAWLALAVGLAGLLYRRVGGSPAVAGLAMLLFAVEDAHALPATWIANRNALLALAVGTAGLLVHLRWRRTKKPRDLLLAVGTMAVALLCGEAALGALAYVVAWQLTMDPGSWRQRLLRLAPYAALVLAWRGVYDALGYGVRASGLYIDPGHEPLAFLAALLERAPLLLTGQWLQAPLDAWLVLPRKNQLGAAGFGAIVCIGLLLFFLPLLRRRPRARFWAVGMVLSLVPLCATFPMDRLLIFAGLGAAALLAELVGAMGWLDAPAIFVTRPARKLVLALLLLLHLPFAAPLLSVKAATSLDIFAPIDAILDHLGEVPRLEERTLVFVNGHDMLDLALCYTTAGELGYTPRRILQLGSVTTPVDIERIDANTLEVTQVGGVLGMAFDQLFRHAALPFEQGQRIERPDASYELAELTEDGRPLRWRVHFARPLEDPSLYFLRFRMFGMERWTPIPVGERERIALALHRITAAGEPIPGDEGLH